MLKFGTNIKKKKEGRKYLAKENDKPFYKLHFSDLDEHYWPMCKDQYLHSPERFQLTQVKIIFIVLFGVLTLGGLVLVL